MIDDLKIGTIPIQVFLSPLAAEGAVAATSDSITDIIFHDH